MGTKRLPFPGGAYDAVHCARCRVPWHIWGGKLLLEVNRLLRPGGLFVWSATPVYRKTPEDVQIWHGELPSPINSSHLICLALTPRRAALRRTQTWRRSPSPCAGRW
ncbi:Os12g0178250 [Oryza sativa Japonica Group]|uniref:Methyltransferase n=1 Tax=Oryza sativa subsp. japonica TaxID=39947 RepID=A0A0P0Y859_ORYSJ|nr:hypothetical protein EE612_058146 [Oryza sativa]BAT16124.1 Os12g0178250 [Oryza sativa Japonica Group]